MKALIFSGGAFDGIPDDLNLSEFSLIIAADKGYQYAKSAGITPEIFVGDCDSLPESIKIESETAIRLTPIKDMTDTQEAISIAMEKGATQICVLGALGNRIDHTLANIHLLKFCLDRGVNAYFLDNTTFVTLIDRPTKFPKKDGCCISAIPLTTCEHVFIKGVFYPLDDAVMDLGNPYGVSNEFTEEVAEFDPGTGLLLIMICKSE